jgi:uncharacterized protein YjiS (DUF1127 family)
MAHLLSGERPALAAAPTSLWQTLANHFAKARQARARRLALETLLEFDTARLDDLGINRSDLFEAMESPSSRPGLRLTQRRAESARHWLDR